jgi:hypothetical protein
MISSAAIGQSRSHNYDNVARIIIWTPYLVHSRISMYVYRTTCTGKHVGVGLLIVVGYNHKVFSLFTHIYIVPFAIILFWYAVVTVAFFLSRLLSSSLKL